MFKLRNQSAIIVIPVSYNATHVPTNDEHVVDTVEVCSLLPAAPLHRSLLIVVPLLPDVNATELLTKAENDHYLVF